MADSRSDLHLAPVPEHSSTPCLALQVDEGVEREKAAAEALAAAERATKEAEERAAQVGGGCRLEWGQAGREGWCGLLVVQRRSGQASGFKAARFGALAWCLPHLPCSSSLPPPQRAAELEELRAALKTKEEEAQKLDAQHGADLRE